MIRSAYPMKKILSPSTCSQILRECQRAGEYEPSLLGYNQDGTLSKPDLDTGKRSSSSVHVTKPLASRTVMNNVMDLFYTANRYYGFEIYHDVQLELIRYDSETKDKFDWHTDDLPDERMRTDRKLSMSIQLSDSSDYTDCDLEIEGFDGQLDVRDLGTVVVFPSYLKHRVTPCTSGTRNALVAWLYGPEWK